MWTRLKQIKDAVFLAAIAAAILQFNAMRIEAMDVKEQIGQLAEIARDLRDPNLWLRNYLLVQGVDSTTARTWSTMQKGPVPDSTGTPLVGIPFLHRKSMPDRGVLMIYVARDSTVVLDTLWAFVEAK